MTRINDSRSDPAREAAELAVLEMALGEVFAQQAVSASAAAGPRMDPAAAPSRPPRPAGARASLPGAAAATSGARWLAAALVLLGASVVAATMWLPRDGGASPAAAAIDLWPRHDHEPATLAELQRRLAIAESATVRAEGAWSGELGRWIDFARFDLDDLFAGELRPPAAEGHLRALAASIAGATVSGADTATVWTHHLTVRSGDERSTVLLSIGGPRPPRIGFRARTGPMRLEAPAFPFDDLLPGLDALTAKTIERLGLVLGAPGFAAVPATATRLRLFGVPASAAAELARYPALRQLDLLAAPEWHSAAVLRQLPATLGSLSVLAAELPPDAYPVLGALSALHELFLVDAPMFGTLVGDSPCRQARHLDDRALLQLRGLRALRELMLVGATCTDAGLRALADLPLRQLALVECPHIAGFGLAELHSLHQLTIRGGALEAAAIAGLGALPGLTQLLLLEPVGPVPLEALAALPSLANLHLAGAFAREALPQLAACRALRKLTLQLDPPLQDGDLPLLHGLVQLERLQLPGANVGDDALAALRRALPAGKVTRDW